MPNGEPVDAPNMVAELISRKRRGLELAEQIIDEDYKQGLETQSQDVIEGVGGVLKTFWHEKSD